MTNNMLILIRKLAEYLNLFKDFDTNYKAENKKGFILNYQNKKFIVNVTEVNEKEKNLHDFDLLDKYCKWKIIYEVNDYDK